MKSVAFIEHLGTHAGLDTYCKNTVEAISDNHDLEVHLFSDKRHFSDDYYSYDYFKNVFKGKVKLFKISKFYNAFLKSLLRAKIRKINIVHLHFYGVHNFYALNLLLAKIFNFKVVATIHDIIELNENKQRIPKYLKSIILLLDGIIFHSEYAKSIFQKDSSFSKVSNVNVIYGCDINFKNSLKTSRAQSLEKLKLSSDNIYILFFGQIKKIKNLSLLIKSMKHVSKNIKDVKLIIAGKVWQDNFSDYEKLIDKLNLKDVIIPRIEFVPNNQVQDYFNISEFTILPYRRIYNSGVLIRSFSYKRSVIASNIPLFKELINENTGYLFEENDEISLSNTIIKALNDNNKELHENCYNFIIKLLDRRKNSKKYHLFYESIYS